MTPARPSPWPRRLLILLAVVLLILFLLLPLLTVFASAFAHGVAAYGAALADPDALSAIGLTLTVAALVLPFNLLFGLAAAWAVAKFDFPGKSLVITLIDLPFSVSPVISGLIFLLLFGLQGWLGPWLAARDLRVMFALPGMVLVTLFVTLPFVARELIPLMEEQGTEEEEAALMLGASGWRIFWRITLPNVRWGLLAGVLLSNARAMGEFGAVSMVSGHILGLTMTLPQQVERFYNDYNTVGAFSLASLLALLGLLTLVAKSLLEKRTPTSGA
ncbi:sulfate transport system permease protein CysW [mine drainage metagenome]|uniref:Sulfate transport system permease protein CysW n=1 Tax=mine drainage metagenome TaxID=410659 RepID=A0A1J5QXD9_9ZZZZ